MTAAVIPEHERRGILWLLLIPLILTAVMLASPSFVLQHPVAIGAAATLLYVFGIPAVWVGRGESRLGSHPYLSMLWGVGYLIVSPRGIMSLPLLAALGFAAVMVAFCWYLWPSFWYLYAVGINLAGTLWQCAAFFGFAVSRFDPFGAPR